MTENAEARFRAVLRQRIARLEEENRKLREELRWATAQRDALTSPQLAGLRILVNIYRKKIKAYEANGVRTPNESAGASSRLPPALS